MQRRSFLASLFAAPAAVKAASLVPKVAPAAPVLSVPLESIGHFNYSVVTVHEYQKQLQQRWALKLNAERTAQAVR